MRNNVENNAQQDEKLTFRIRIDRDVKKKKDKIQLKHLEKIDRQEKKLILKKMRLSKASRSSQASRASLPRRKSVVSTGSKPRFSVTSKRSRIVSIPQDEDEATQPSTAALQARKSKLSFAAVPRDAYVIPARTSISRLSECSRKSVTSSERRGSLHSTVSSQQSGRSKKNIIVYDIDDERRPSQESAFSYYSSASITNPASQSPSLMETQKKAELIRRKSISPSLALERLRMQQKRERDKRVTLLDMRATLPNYALSEIRELRMALQDAIIQNLRDDEYHSTASFVKEIIEFQDDMRKEAGPGTNIFAKPQLKLSKDVLKLLVQALKTSETYHHKNNLAQECEEFLKIAVHFAFTEYEDWWWLGEQLLVQAVSVSESYSPEIGPKAEALSRYVYGKYLLDKEKEYDKALKQLKIVRHIAAGKSWSSKLYFPDAVGTLLMQTNHMIYDCIINEVTYLMHNEEYDKAMILADQARRRALEACHRNGETRALVLKGICETATKRYNPAISSFLRAFTIQQRVGSIEGLCKIRIHMAKAYLLNNCPNQALETLLEIKLDAKENNLPYYSGLAYKNLGEYYLTIGDAQKATALINKSLEFFKICGHKVAVQEADSSRALKAIAGGLQLFPTYAEILANSDHCYDAKENLEILLKWKEDRTDFCLHIEASTTYVIDDVSRKNSE